MKNQTLASICFFASLAAVVLAVIGAFGTDLWLASTQWILVAAVLSIWSVYLKV